MADQHKNFAYSLVATAPSPATSGTSLVVTTGDGAKFPTPPFNATVWATGVQPSTTNAEIVRVTGISTDTLTIVRAQETNAGGPAARTIVVGDQIAETITSYVAEIAERGPAHFAVASTDFLEILSAFATVASGGSTTQGGQIAGHPGILQLASGTTAGGVAGVGLGMAASAATISPSDNIEVEFIFQTPSVITDTDLRGGFVDQVITPADGLWWEKLAGDTAFFFVSNNGGVADTRQNMGTTVVASTWYSIVVGRLGSQLYWSINRAQPTFYTPTNMPSGGNGTMHAYMQIKVNGTASTRTVNVDFIRTLVSGLSR
jgi:hypothetical protein